jgi:hypothetical protein
MLRDIESIPKDVGTLHRSYVKVIPHITKISGAAESVLQLNRIQLTEGLSLKNEAVQYSPEVFLEGHFTLFKIFLKMFGESFDACEDLCPRGVDGS